MHIEITEMLKAMEPGHQTLALPIQNENQVWCLKIRLTLVPEEQLLPFMMVPSIGVGRNKSC